MDARTEAYRVIAAATRTILGAQPSGEWDAAIDRAIRRLYQAGYNRGYDEGYTYADDMNNL